MLADQEDIYGFIKPELDAHTLGIRSAMGLLLDCGYQTLVGDEAVEKAASNMENAGSSRLILDWIRRNKVSRIGISYRLDEKEAVHIVRSLLEALYDNNMLDSQGGPVKAVFFGGLPFACRMINEEYHGAIATFQGGETALETLIKLNIPLIKIPKGITEGCKYDEERMEFGRSIIAEGEYKNYHPVSRAGYPSYGTFKDTVLDRINYNAARERLPLIRAHVGPYSSSQSREEMVQEFLRWSRELAKAGLLDILSIGGSQLTQSNFGEVWEGLPNGGGVPINSPEEYRRVWENSRPMLIRTYAGTKNILTLAQMYEETINNSWHALSLWWFNRLDGRGPYDLYTNLSQHIETIKYISGIKKPFEPNVSHHFAFRGADDVTYIVSAYLAVKLAKRLGIRTVILQNMLNTPRATWGICDLAKSRVLFAVMKELESSDFQVLLQPRAGLDYFKPDWKEAQIQLAAVTALMDDIAPADELSPPIIHVVSYSEAVHIATPEIINDSIKITQFSLRKYRELRRQGKTQDMAENREVQERSRELLSSVKTILEGIERYIAHPYTAEGLYQIFAAGFLPVPDLWNCPKELRHAKEWNTRLIRGSVKLIDENNQPITADRVVAAARDNIEEVTDTLKIIMRDRAY